jgi:thiamine pyrophosphokinase
VQYTQVERAQQESGELASMKRAVVVTGGGGPSHIDGAQITGDDLVICADSGYDLALRLKLKVDLWVGDFDSTLFLDDMQNGIEIIRHDGEQEQSDTELAIWEARQRGCSEYLLIGGGGFRMDHLLATFAVFTRLGFPRLWLTGYEVLHLVESYQRFDDLLSGTSVSLFPATLEGDAVVTATHLAWPLERYRLSLSSLSLSNRVLGPSMEVEVHEGSAIWVSFPVAHSL